MKKISLVLVFALLLSLSFTMAVGARGLDEDTTTVIVISVIAAALTGIIFAVSVIASYKKKLRGTIYPFDKFTHLELTDYYDKYSHSTTTRYKYRDSSRK